LYIAGFAFSSIGFLFNMIIRIYGNGNFMFWNTVDYGLDCIVDGISPYRF